MADAVSTADLEHLWDPAAQPMFTVKPPDWIATYLPRYCQSAADRTDSDCRGLALMVRELQRDAFWKQLFPDWEACCQALFKRPAEWVEQVVQGVRVLHAQGYQGEVSEHQALAAAASQAQPLAEHGGEREGAGRPAILTKLAEAAEEALPLRAVGEQMLNQVDNINLKREAVGGTSQSYLLRRLARDAPDILERVKAGEFRSARAAAIEAGIIKPVPTIRLVADLNVVAAKLCQHLTPEQRHALAEALLQ